MSYNPEDLPRTDGLELALLSEAENAEDYRDLWGTILDDEVFRKIDDKLTNGEADLDVNSVSTDEIDTGQLVEGSAPVVKTWTQDGDNPTDRVANAVSSAGGGVRILLENGIYENDLTIPNRNHIDGVANTAAQGAELQAEWTLDSRYCGFQDFRIGSDGVLNLGENNTFVRFCTVGGTISVQGDNCLITGLRGGAVEFASGTSGGIIDSCTAVTVTDNGDNTVGDIA